MPVFDSLHHILQGLAHSYGFQVRLREHQLMREWPTIVGETVATHTKPDRVKFRTLYVIVDHSVWLHQLTFLKPALLTTLQSLHESPFIQDIVFRVGETTRNQKPSDQLLERNTPSPTLTESSLQEARKIVAQVKDQELQSSLAKVIAKALSST